MATQIEQWYFDTPVVTRYFMTITALITLAVQFEWISWLQLYFDYDLAFYQGQYWRMLTTFMYFGDVSIDWAMDMYFFRLPVDYMFGMLAGHLLWFFDDEWPRHPESGGARILKAPIVLCRLFGQAVQDSFEAQEIQNTEPQQAQQNQQIQETGQYISSNSDTQTALPTNQALSSSAQSGETDKKALEKPAKESLQTPTSTSYSAEKSDVSPSEVLLDNSTRNEKEKALVDEKYPGLSRREPHVFDNTGEDY
ncbi:hypothetical protein H4219_003995 [Mycoemilia scoparia]|uniref:Derlin n=1 Tax=Mycoemilia scoparia TaxID=417184 RepID=A0A9W7ZT44_9FUNG|nr:hypothetical protein H4219_003995 [Mycoemilia scoparia]